MNTMISTEDKAFLKEEGYLLIKNFFDFEQDIAPIQEAIYAVIGLVAKRHGISLNREPFNKDNFDNGIMICLQLIDLMQVKSMIL